MRHAILVLFAAFPLLHGCAPLVVGGAAATGVVVAEDRRTVGTMAEDEGIETKASSRIGDALKTNIHVNVTSYNRTVLLTGEVPTAADKDQAGRIARAVENVRGLYNELDMTQAMGWNSVEGVDYATEMKALAEQFNAAHRSGPTASLGMRKH